jgi:hypothetical protein
LKTWAIAQVALTAVLLDIAPLGRPVAPDVYRLDGDVGIADLDPGILHGLPGQALLVFLVVTAAADHDDLPDVREVPADLSQLRQELAADEDQPCFGVVDHG